MIRAIVDNVDGLRAEMLPPERPHARGLARGSEPLRVLFLQSNDLGATSTSRLFERMSERCGEIESVHVNMRTRGAVRMASARGYLQAWRMAEAWSAVMGRWFDGPLKLERFDVVLVMRQQRALAVARRKARVRGETPPYVIDIDATTICSRRDFDTRQDWPDLDAWVGHRTFRDAAGIGCHSQWAARSVREDYGVDASKVFLYMPSVGVPLGIRAAADRAERQANLEALARGERGEPLRIVFVGHDWERKGGDRLLRWHQERWKERVELHVCSGKAVPERGARNVVWHGAVENRKLVEEVLPRMDVLVLPTVNDTSPIALHEALGCGVAQVSSRLAGIPEIVEDGVTGLLCRPREDGEFVAAVERLLGDPGMLLRMSRASLERGSRGMSAERWFGHLVQNLRRAAEGRPMIAEPGGEGSGAAPSAARPAAVA